MRFGEKIHCDNCGELICEDEEIMKEQNKRRQRGEGYNLIAQCKKCRKEGKRV